MLSFRQFVLGILWLSAPDRNPKKTSLMVLKYH